jgi:hypothetical protein
MMHSPTNLPIVGFTLVLMLCVYVAFRAYKEFTAESNLKSAMYDETGIDGSYNYKLPTGEKVRLQDALLISLKFRPFLVKQRHIYCI